MIDLTYDTALEIYKKDYWDAQELSNFKSQSLANVLYDGCVNQGPGATLTILKKSLDEINIDSTNVNSWNELHDELIDDVNSLTVKKTEKLFHTIKKKRWEKYILIIKKNPRKEKYHDGWKNRLEDITFNDDSIDKNIDIS
jgi:lysozyme family protein